jgi:Tol biopolymer transport system component
VWVINADGTGERVVHNQANQPKSPAWSPDGREIAVNMQQGGRLDYESKCSNSLPSEPLKADEDGDYFRVKVEIEQDGDVDIKFCYTLLPHPFWGLRVIDVPSGTFEDQPRDLFTYAPAWDPTNDWHVVYDGEKGLVNLDLNRGATWALTDKVGDHTPVFSPDGQRIAVAFNQGDNFDIHVMNADGSGRLRLTKTPLSAIVEQGIRGEAQKSWNNVAPTWSPDGSEIAFLTDRTGRWEIWVMNADGSNQRPMFAPGVLSTINFEFNNVDERMLSWGP